MMTPLPIETAIQSDGKTAYLPHPVFQTALFLCTRTRRPDEYRKRSVTVEITNSFQDRVVVRSARTLFACPDMGVFLGVVALIQKHGFHDLIDSVTGETVGRVRSTFPIGELYDLTGMGRSSARERLLTSLETLGSVSLSIRYAETPDSVKRHRYMSGFHMASFWDINIIPRAGRLGSLVEVFPSRYLIPKKSNLWADAEVCNSLRSDTARAIFWSLICRQHYRGTVREWQALLGNQRQAVRNWRSECFLPALDELAKYRYTVSVADDVFTVRRSGNTPEPAQLNVP